MEWNIFKKKTKESEEDSEETKELERIRLAKILKEKPNLFMDKNSILEKNEEKEKTNQIISEKESAEEKNDKLNPRRPNFLNINNQNQAINKITEEKENKKNELNPRRPFLGDSTLEEIEKIETFQNIPEEEKKKTETNTPRYNRIYSLDEEEKEKDTVKDIFKISDNTTLHFNKEQKNKIKKIEDATLEEIPLEKEVIKTKEKWTKEDEKTLNNLLEIIETQNQIIEHATKRLIEIGKMEEKKKQK